MQVLQHFDLISTFRERAGVPIALSNLLRSTGPVVRALEEAISCFLRTDMDVLVLGSHLIDRHAPEFPEHQRKRIILKPGELPGAGSQRG